MVAGLVFKPVAYPHLSGKEGVHLVYLHTKVGGASMRGVSREDGLQLSRKSDAGACRREPHNSVITKYV